MQYGAVHIYFFWKLRNRLLTRDVIFPACELRPIGIRTTTPIKNTHGSLFPPSTNQRAPFTSANFSKHHLLFIHSLLYSVCLLTMMKDQEDYKMYFLENRLKTFMGWPFEEGCACTPEKVSNIKLRLHR